MEKNPASTLGSAWENNSNNSMAELALLRVKQSASPKNVS